MLHLLAYALIPVLLGAAVAFVPGVERRFFRPVHTFAFAAALAVVFAELLPGALAGAGPAALLVFAAGIVAPAALDRGMRRVATHDHDHDHDHGDGAGLELAFGALLVHQAVDGLQVGASGVIEHGMTIVLAVAAHSTPLIAVTVLAYAHHDGRRSALVRATALAGATALGVVVGAGVSNAWLAPVEPWLRAAISGVLLYILGHDLAEQRPHTTGGLWSEWLATLFGMTVPLLWLDVAGHHHDTVHPLTGLGTGLALSAAFGVQVLWLLGKIPRRFPFGHE